MTVEIDALPNDQPIGWADAQISRTGAGVANLSGNLTLSTSNASVTADYFRSTDGGTQLRSFSGGGLSVAQNRTVAWTSGSSYNNSQDVILQRDAAGVLAQRNGTNAQAFHVYNTYTDSSNYERGVFEWDSNALRIRPEAAGTGSNRQLKIGVGTSDCFTIEFSRCDVHRSLTPGAAEDGLVDLGDSFRYWRDLYLKPSSSVTPTENGGLCIEATDNSTLTFKLKGSDGTVRSGTVALS